MRKFLFLALLCPFLSMCQPISLKGKIINEQRQAVAGATVTVKRVTHDAARVTSTATNSAGEFSITHLGIGDTITVTAIGYAAHTEYYDYTLTKESTITIMLTRKVSVLDEAVIIAYGNTTRRLSTSSISTIKSEDIARQPVSNPLSALQGFIPGLLVNQQTGRPGSNISVQLRGINSLKQGTQPLFIVDGVPFMLNTGSLSQMAPIVQSIFNTLNPADIESIEVLKDADATAIYGSQGANGVVLITTKKGAPGKSQLSVSYYTAFAKTTRSLALLNTEQYLKMRREAFANDGATPNAATAPDLLIWDTTRYTNWQQELTGGTARTHDAQASLSGKAGTINYFLSANYRSETSVFPQSQPVTRSTAHLNFSHISLNKKWSMQFSALYAQHHKTQPFTDLTSLILMPPNAPAPYDSIGKLAWTSGIDNPFSYLRVDYRSTTANLLANTSLSYTIIDDLLLRVNLGYNTIGLTEQKQTPVASLRPSAAARGSLQWSQGSITSWLAEPQFTYKKQLSKHVLELLAGCSFQERKQTETNILAKGYTDDELIGTLAAAAEYSVSNDFSQYKYAAAFGRISYGYSNRYLANINVRRDGSSRFGPANRFSNFGAFGLAWLLSEEAWFKHLSPTISYAKIRGSYGITGNDQIGDYKYFDTWAPNAYSQYASVAGVLPTALFNPAFQWEKSKKLEAALELGFFNDRLVFTASWYRNLSSNQLVNYKLPSQTGFTSILKNLDARILNTGIEFQLAGTLMQSKTFSWRLNANFSIPKNKLLSYPDLEKSSDKLNFAIGYPLNIDRNFTYTGVNTSTGVYEFLDVDRNGSVTSPNDLTNIQVMSPECFGGIQNNFSYRNWQLSFLFYGIRQMGHNYLLNLSMRPGTLSNQPTFVLDRWQNPDDITSVQRYSALASSPANAAYNRFRNSSALVTDASFIRLRNLSLWYSLPAPALKRLKLENLRFYVEGQNLFTLTSYKGADPETQNLLSLPPLKMLAAGIQFTL